MFFQYWLCPHWPYWDIYGDPKRKRRRSKFAEMLLELGTLHEKDLIARLPHVEVKHQGTLAVRHKKTIELMREGTQRIYHGVLIADASEGGATLVGEPDILERRDDDSSDIGPYYYVAVDIKSAEKLSDAHKYQLAFYAELLEAAQGVRPHAGYVLNASGARLEFPLKDFEQKFHEALREIREIVLRGKRPEPQLSSGCKQSPWFGECIALSEETHDVALLYNLRKKTMLAMRDAGVRTVADAAAMDIDTIAEDGSTSLSHATLERHKLQAEALLAKRHFVRKPIDLPEAPLEIFFDIEGDPLRQLEYLFGFLIREGGKERYECQLAKEEKEEKAMWREFLEWIKGLPDDYVVYHYGTYEQARLSILENEYGGGSAALERFRDSMVDLNAVVKESIVFPLYFYGIKDIGAYIGFERSKKIAGGGDSVAFYERWLEKRDQKTLDAIIKYNKDDVIATRYLKDWLAKERDAGALHS